MKTSKKTGITAVIFVYNNTARSFHSICNSNFITNILKFPTNLNKSYITNFKYKQNMLS